MILGNKNDFHVCAVCARRSAGLGYAPADRKPVLWVCDDCLPLAREAYAMRKFDAFENIALTDAVKATADEQIGAVVEAIWASGVQTLADLSPEKFSEVVERLVLDGALHEATRKGIMAFGDSIRKQCSENKAPF